MAAPTGAWHAFVCLPTARERSVRQGGLFVCGAALPPLARKSSAKGRLGPAACLTSAESALAPRAASFGIRAGLAALPASQNPYWWGRGLVCLASTGGICIAARPAKLPASLNPLPTYDSSGAVSTVSQSALWEPPPRQPAVARPAAMPVSRKMCVVVGATPGVKICIYIFCCCAMFLGVLGV